MSQTTYAEENPPYASLKNTTTVVKFDDKDWYLIDYDSDTITLLTKECVAASMFDKKGLSNTYSGSNVETAVNDYYSDNISSDAKKAVNGNGMFLLTLDQANTIYKANPDVLKCSQASGAKINHWWLSSPSLANDGSAAFVFGDTGDVNGYGDPVGNKYGVRPALKLNLKSVIFSYNEFIPNAKDETTITVQGGNTIEKTYGDTDFTIQASVPSEAGSGTWKWTGNDASVAAVTDAGTVSIKGAGNAIITASFESETAIGEALINLTVNKKDVTVTGVAVSDKEYDGGTAANKNVRLAAVPAGANPSTGSFAEAGAGVTIKDGDALAVMGVTPGTVKLKGIMTDGSKKKVKCAVTVRGQVTGLKLKTSKGKKGANDVTLSDNAVTTDTIEYTSVMKANSKMTLTPVVDINGVSGSATDKATKKTYAAYKKCTDTSVSYRSFDTSVATVDKKGKISVKKGTAGKTATIYVVSADGQQKAEILITVK